MFSYFVMNLHWAGGMQIYFRTKGVDLAFLFIKLAIGLLTCFTARYPSLIKGNGAISTEGHISFPPTDPIQLLLLKHVQFLTPVEKSANGELQGAWVQRQCFLSCYCESVVPVAAFNNKQYLVTRLTLIGDI